MVSEKLLRQAIEFACGSNYLPITAEELTSLGDYYGVTIPIEISKYYRGIEADGDKSFGVLANFAMKGCEEKYNELTYSLWDLRDAILKNGYKKEASV